MGFFMQRDVLIVGFGLAGWALTEALKKQDTSFVVFDTSKLSSSRVATGIYNPVVLKRFRAIWKASDIMDHSIPFYMQPKYLSALHPMPIHRIFASAAEQNDWSVATDKPDLSTFLNSNILTNSSPNINAPCGVGVVENTGWIDTNALLTIGQQELENNACFVNESFDYDGLSISSSGVSYKKWNAKHIVFAEGVGVSKNPWFAKLPIIPNKGEWLIVSCKGLALRQMVKGSVFIVPLGNDLYRVGATYAREFENVLPTEVGKEWLVARLTKLTNLPFSIVYHGAGLRPTTPDRKPVIGQHPVYDALWCINGLGSRGVLWAPYLASLLTNALKGKQKIAEVLHVRRFLTS